MTGVDMTPVSWQLQCGAGLALAGRLADSSALLLSQDVPLRSSLPPSAPACRLRRWLVPLGSC